MDETLPPEEEEEIRRLIRSQQPVIHGYHQLRTRKAGHYRFIEVHIQVDGKDVRRKRPTASTRTWSSGSRSASPTRRSRSTPNPATATARRNVWRAAS